MGKTIKATMWISAVLTLCSVLVSAQINPKDLKAKYRKWLQEEVVYITTQEEKESFLLLDSNDLRDKFIEVFWDLRDPTPGTLKNEFLEEHYERIEYANKFFGIRSAKNGWRSDRGRYYILLGPPKQRMEYPSDTFVYPCELWFYSGDSKVSTAQFFYLIFFKARGGTDYNLYHPALDGPAELTWKGDFDFSEQEVLESIRTLSFDLATAAQGYDVMDPGNKLKSEVLIGTIDAIPENIWDGSWASAFVNSRGKVDVNYSFSSLQIQSKILLHTPPDGRQQLHYAYIVFPEDLSIGKHEDNYYAVFEIIPSLADQDGEAIFEESSTVELSWTEKQFSTMRHKPILFTDVIPIIPGDYRFTVRIRNKVAKTFYMFSRDISIPMPRTGKFSLNNILLSYSNETSSSSGNTVSPFRIFNVDYKPSVISKFAEVDNVHIFTELFFPLPRNGQPGLGEITYEYNLYLDDQLVKKMTHIVPNDMLNSIGIHYLSRQLSLENLANGEYRLELVVQEDSLGLKDTKSVLFNIDDPNNIPRPNIVQLNRRMNRSDSTMLLKHAALLLKGGYSAVAVSEYQNYLKKNPEDLEAAMSLGNIYLKDGKYQQAFDLVKKVEWKDPNNRELVLFLSETSRALGNIDKAINYYERLLFVYPDDIEVLNGLGDLYVEINETEKVKLMFEKSLGIRQDQPAVNKILATLQSN